MYNHEPEFLKTLKSFLDSDNTREVRIYGVFKASESIKDYLYVIDKYSNLISNGYNIKHIIQRSSAINLEKTVKLYREYFQN